MVILGTVKNFTLLTKVKLRKILVMTSSILRILLTVSATPRLSIESHWPGHNGSSHIIVAGLFKVYSAIGYTEVWILYPLFAFNAEPWKPNEDTTQLTLYPSGFPEVESGMTKSRFKMLSLVFSRGCPFTSVEWKVFDPKNTTAREIYALCNHSSPFIGLVTKMVMQKKITMSLKYPVSGFFAPDKSG